MLVVGTAVAVAAAKRGQVPELPLPLEFLAVPLGNLAIFAVLVAVGLYNRRKRDRAILSLLLGCGLRCRELAELTLDHLQQREDHWAVVDLIGKAGHLRTVPVPDWVKQITDEWVVAAGVGSGRLFRCVSRSGTVWGEGITEKVVWHVVLRSSQPSWCVPKLAPHDLRRSCARLCHAAGGEMEQIQFLLGHVSVQTTEKYLGCKQRLRGAVNDRIGIEPAQ